MNKTQKRTIEICLLLIIVSILIPPFNQYAGTTIKAGILKSEWNFIWVANKDMVFRKIRFDILALEWIGIIALGGFFFFIKEKKMENK